MDSNMDLDVGKAPATEPASIGTLDGWIESLMNCKQLAESDVSRLCERVRMILQRSSLGARLSKNSES